VSGDAPVGGIVAEAAFLLHTGWSSEQYDNAPDDLVGVMLRIMTAQAEQSKERSEEMEDMG
jgi:TorA maturation chaperone TorD